MVSRPIIMEEGYIKSEKELQNVASNFGWYEQPESEGLAELERQKAKEA